MQVEVKTLKLSKVKLNPDNPRRISERDMDRLVKSLQDFPDMMKLREIVVDETMTVIGGNMRVLALRKMGIQEATAKICKGLTADQKREFVIKDNAAFGEWDMDVLANGWSDLPLGDWGVDIPEEWAAGQTEEPQDAEPQIDKAAELNKVWKVKRGDLWRIGEHRLLCGDSTKAEDVALVMGGENADLILTDPPYSSGGFQEAGRVSGSIGTKRKKADGKEYTPKLCNDNLSSRGYCALIKSVLGMWSPLWCYVFTDWRMWVYLFDVMESLGFGVRSMIVWDKGIPGMGRGWRSQHELVMFGIHVKAEFDNKMASGNVLHSSRTGNPNHPTEKPVDILETILTVSDFCQMIADPFLGSGTTMVACQNLNRKCLGIEISPEYCAVILQRMKDAFPGIEIKRIGK